MSGEHPRDGPVQVTAKRFDPVVVVVLGVCVRWPEIADLPDQMILDSGVKVGDEDRWSAAGHIADTSDGRPWISRTVESRPIHPKSNDKLGSQLPGLNRGPTVYETVALPLSYTGTIELAAGIYHVADGTETVESRDGWDGQVGERAGLLTPPLLHADVEERE